MTIVYIGLGSNLDHPLQQLLCAVEKLRALPSTQVIDVSPFYGSTAIGPGEQPDYVNGVVSLQTKLDAHHLLDQLQYIEHEQGRKRGDIQWIPRTLDLDILLFGDQSIHSTRLQVPHPRMTERLFVIKPLLDIAPNCTLPYDGQPLANLLEHLDSTGLWQLPDTLT